MQAQLRRLSFGPPHFIFPNGSGLRCDFDKWSWRQDYHSPWMPLSTSAAFELLKPFMYEAWR